MLQFTGSQRVGHDWATELNCTELLVYVICLILKHMYMKVQGFPGGSVVKNMPVMQETWVWSLVRRIPWRREWLPTTVFFPGESWLQSMGWQRGRHDWATNKRKKRYIKFQTWTMIWVKHIVGGNHRLSTRCFFHLVQSLSKHMLASTRNNT